MKRYVYVVLGLSTFFLICFGLVQWLQLPLLQDVSALGGWAGWGAVGLGWVLLVADIFVPVPASAVMLMNGAVLGLAGGTLASWTGGLLATMLGWALGRQSGSWVNKGISDVEKGKAQRFIAKWGSLAIGATRGVPVLSESFAIVAGSMGMRWQSMLSASAVGLLPPAVIYAWAGQWATQQNANPESLAEQLGVGTWSFLIVLMVSGLFWLAGRFFFTETPAPKDTPPNH